MQIKGQQLTASLQKSLAPIYFISGDEPQQLTELSDLIRQTAKAKGYTSREFFFVDKNFDWKQLNIAAGTLSIFSDKKLIDLKLPSGTPGTEGGKVLINYCRQPPEDTILVITAGKISNEAKKSSWFQTIDKAGCIIQVWPLAGQDLLHWIQTKMLQRGLLVELATVKLLADRVEGNLLAAAQEIEKLYVLYGEGTITQAQLNDAVADSSRYDVFKLVESALAAKPDKILKILAALKAEGIAPVVVLWAIAREARSLITIKAAISQGESKDIALKKQGIWGEHKFLVEAALKRLSMTDLNKILIASAKTDCQIKGQQPNDPWETLLTTCLTLASITVLN